MCLARPFKLLSLAPDGLSGVVDAGGATLTVGLILTPEAKVGDFVLVHAGAAIEVLADAEAQTILDAFDDFARLNDLVAPADDPHDRH
jgi:hydrogenase expression/formation protein HypC